MWKPIAAGLMCLGFVTLSVAISQGQDESSVPRQKNDLIVIDGELNATEVQAGDAKDSPRVTFIAPVEVQASGVGIGASGEANISVNGQKFRIIKSENGDVVVSNEDGKTIEKYSVGGDPTRVKLQARVVKAASTLDPQAREGLEKLTAALKEQIQKLESEGKKEEAQQKSRSLRAIEFLLHGNPGVGPMNKVRYLHDPQQTMEEIKKLHARLNALVEESSELPEGATRERDKIKQEIEKVKKEIAEKHQSLTAPAPVGGQPHQFGFGQPMAPGMVAPQFGPHHPGGMGFPGGGFGFARGQGQPPGFGSSEGMALLRKSEALSRAAAQLKEAGLHDQAKPLQEEAEKLGEKAKDLMRAEAEKHQSEAGAGAGGRGFGGFGIMHGGPPMDLHNSIRELHEQIQQLRKEVGELRELLQRK